MATIEDAVNAQLSAYLTSRAALIAHEKELRHGTPPLSPTTLPPLMTS